MDQAENSELLEQTTRIAVAYLANNTLDVKDVPSLITEIHHALTGLSTGAVRTESHTPKPAVPVNQSIRDDYLVCLEDGKKFKSLRRHLRTHYNLSPEEYRERWGLPHDYPMVASNYAKLRSQLAKKTGLGTRK
ncbi:MAG: MucR family transcriptional regulator [Hyphomicrobiaceae bacterium]